MLRYKLLLSGRRSNLEKENLDKIDNLENHGMIDMMLHQHLRHESIFNRTLEDMFYE